MKNVINQLLLVSVSIVILSSCSNNFAFHEDFDSINDRIWVNQDFWTIPIEDWRVNEGRLECVGSRKNMKTVVLSHVLLDEGNFLINLRMGILNKADNNGSAGLIIGLQDDTDMDIRSLAHFGTGLNAGVNTDMHFFLGEISKPLPENFDLDDFVIHIDGYHEEGEVIIRMQATDINGLSTEKIEKNDLESLHGAVAIVNNHPGGRNYSGANQFWFDEINISGSSIMLSEENRFGPILWSMYTLSKGYMKMTAQMPPLGKDDNQDVELYLKNNGNWELAGKESIEEYSRTAIFRVEDWDNLKDQPYRLMYIEKDKNNNYTEHIREGIIPAEPNGRPLVMGGLTCQYNYGFPYSPLVNNLEKLNPDILYFSGDQIYEGNGGYGIVRFPADRATLNYLGKWYLFGWAFGDIMKNRPTICIPDDHDVFQGNLWGDGGKNIPFETFQKHHGTSGGYVEPFEMVNAVHRTQSGHLPDCFDPTPMEQGINPYYTELVYGRVSFAITGDRMFKSGPNNVAFWEGRQDHVKKPISNMKILDKPGLKLLGDRQILFLKNWAMDWAGADMKCLLSQTIFTNVATHHGGNKMILFADLDSGGWPMTPRDEVVSILRSCAAFHIAGDQHLPSLIQYGLEDYRDAGWAFCTPAITVGYQRRFFPEKVGLEISTPPENGFPNTGKYTDPFGSPSYVYAVGNPEDDTKAANRYERAQKCSSGFGIIHFDTKERTIKAEAYRFLADMENTNNLNNQFPGWPHTITQIENFGQNRSGELEEIELNPETEFIQVFDEKSGEFQYSFRPNKNIFTPWVFNKGRFTVKTVNTKTLETRELTGLKSK